MERDALLDSRASVPAGLQHPSFLLTPLMTANAELDYAAYMASPEVIRVHSDGRWPVDGFTLEQAREQAGRHEADHGARRSFTFVVLDPAEKESLGCLYLNPLHDYFRRVGADQQTRNAFPETTAMTTFWVRQDHQATGLVGLLAEAVNTWLLTAWPLRSHLFRVLPGEEASLAALEQLPLQRVHPRLRDEERPYVWHRPA